MAEPESKLDMAERHVREGTECVERQKAIVDELERDGHRERAEEARKLLSTLEESLRLAEYGLCRERREAGIEP